MITILLRWSLMLARSNPFPGGMRHHLTPFTELPQLSGNRPALRIDKLVDHAVWGQ